MPIDYKSIRKKNQREYSPAVRKNVFPLFRDLYSRRTHFIYEILQNTEDALRKRAKRSGPRTIKFSLTADRFVASHFGKLFDEYDVKSICRIGESAKKELTDIGKFGIGFKSVYAFTDKPEIHSGQEHFAIEDYVLPKVLPEIPLMAGETKIIIPFKDDEQSAYEDILNELRELGSSTLLFLREIAEISWEALDGSSGRYSRIKVDTNKQNVRRVLLTGEDDERGVTEEEWLLFSRRVHNDGKNAGHVEIAFALNANREDGPSIRKVEDSKLSVFFPTEVSTHLGFLAQGPYRTTPARDNIPQDDPWNKHLVRETARLLTTALKRLKNLGLLDVSAIECLPMNPPSIAGIILDREDWRFGPLFHATKALLISEPLLPAYGGRYITGESAKLANSRDLRNLITDEQLCDLYDSDKSLRWLSEEITQDRTPRIHKYLTSELDIDEMTPESFVGLFSLSFLEAQPDEWMRSLYEFLNGQRRLLQRLKTIPLLRMEDGSHAKAFVGEKRNAYLPGETRTEFPTIKQSVCQSEGALEFLKVLGLQEPDLADDVIENILPKYSGSDVNVSDQDYENDIGRILQAHATDSVTSRIRLISALRKVKFIQAVDVSSGESQFVRPSDACMATERLTGLFEGVPGVLLVDKAKECLTGERIRDLMRAVGTPEHLHPIKIDGILTESEKLQLREDSVWPSDITRWRGESVDDYVLRGLDVLMEVIADLPSDLASKRSRMLWEALRDVGPGAFEGEYQWFYNKVRRERFPAKFIRTLNETAWVPDKEGLLHAPIEVSFKDTGWVEDPYLLSKIEFRPAVIDELAVEAGLEPGILDVLKKRGITTETQLIDLLGIDEDSGDNGLSSNGEASSVASTQSAGGSGSNNSSENGRATGSVGEGREATNGPTGGADKTKVAGRREFVSYIGVSPEEPSTESDGLSHEERISLEQKGIDLIIAEEPALQRTKPNNPGFDLLEVSDGGEIVRFIEVKTMSGTLQNRPATLTKKQFEFAQQEGDSYWLYIVENAGDPNPDNIIKIRDPAGWASTFTFDHGWKEVSQDAKSE